MIIKTAGSFHTNSYTREDLVQQGYIITIDSMRTYDQNKSLLYFGYLKKCLQYSYYKMLKTREVPCLNKIMNDGMEFIDTVKDAGLCVEDVIIERDVRSALFKAVRLLPNKQRHVIAERFFKGRELKEIAAEQGVNYVNILKTQRRALFNLRKALGEII